MARTMKDRTIPDTRWTFRLPKVWSDILEAEAAVRNAALQPDERKTTVSSLSREAIQNYFSLPSVDTKTDDALVAVSG
jgi:hypothetical protein